jgi:hypothetical protein
MESSNKFSLVAPCGMNCEICRAYLREKNKCPGCRGVDTNKSVTRVRCKIKNCEVLKNENAKFCFECGNFPCENLKHLDYRYRTKYNMSMIENLENINNFGIKKFLKNEDVRWTCSECGGTICVHTGYCYSCGKK